MHQHLGPRTNGFEAERYGRIRSATTLGVRAGRLDAGRVIDVVDFLEPGGFEIAISNQEKHAEGDDLKQAGVAGSVEVQVERLMENTLNSGLDGVVCSAHEIKTLRKRFGPEPVLMVPGIRPAGHVKGKIAIFYRFYPHLDQSKPLAGTIDFAVERARLEKEAKRIEGEVERIDKKLGNAQFVERAPEEVIAEQREKRADYVASADKVRSALEMLA